MIQIENLHKSFGDLRVLSGIDLTINKGESVVVIGQSGCGKSVTALSIIQLVPEPAGRIAGGEILLRGKNIIIKFHDLGRCHGGSSQHNCRTRIYLGSYA